MISSMLRQRLTLERTKTGETISDIPASVQDRIFLNQIELPVEEGDVFAWRQPSGLIKRMLVTKVTLYHTSSPLDHYEIDYVPE